MNSLVSRYLARSIAVSGKAPRLLVWYLAMTVSSSDTSSRRSESFAEALRAGKAMKTIVKMSPAMAKTNVVSSMVKPCLWLCFFILGTIIAALLIKINGLGGAISDGGGRHE